MFYDLLGMPGTLQTHSDLLATQDSHSLDIRKLY
jgi:hypothetical protein